MRLDEPQDHGPFDVILVGSGNGACAFLSHFLHAAGSAHKKVAVIEEGSPFFKTSSLTHQYVWAQSYGEADIWQLHNATTANGTPVIAGRARTQGGGGSLNYTMIHESSQWLTRHIGEDVCYWDSVKGELKSKFNRPDPVDNPTPMTQHVLNVAQSSGLKDGQYALSNDSVKNIPNYVEPVAGAPNRLLHVFPTQFDRFGMRSHSGVSLVAWEDRRITFMPRTRVTALEFAPARPGEHGAACMGVSVARLDAPASKQRGTVQLVEDGGLVVMCAGAATPRLLLDASSRTSSGSGGVIGGGAIGKAVNDHILLPLGVYAVQDINVTQEDAYNPVFATSTVKPHGAYCSGWLELMHGGTGRLHTRPALAEELNKSCWTS
jgi:hypothetical protein